MRNHFAGATEINVYLSQFISISISCAEQLLLAPTPVVIGVPSCLISIFMTLRARRSLPDDIWMVDLDSNKLTPAKCDGEIPPLPEPEGTILKNHLKQVCVLRKLRASFMAFCVRHTTNSILSQ